MRRVPACCPLVVALITTVACAQQPRQQKGESQTAATAETQKPSQTATAGQNVPAPSFPRFWTDFRAAVLANDREKVASMTKFPFHTRGTLDSNPTKTYERADFLKLLDTLMRQDPGLSAEPDTMRHYIEQRPQPAEKDVLSDGTSARVGNFEFQSVKGKWLFTRAYVED